MDEPTRTPLDPGELIEVIPGRVAVQTGEEFSHVSEGFAAAVGAERESLRGDRWRSRFDPETAARIDDGIAEARSRGRWEGRFGSVGGNGATAGISLTLSAMDGDRIVWSVEPLTGDQTKARDLYETIIETVDDGVYVTDENLRVVFANERFCELFGRSREAVIGMDGRALYERSDELADADAIRDRLLANGDTTGSIRVTLPAPGGGERVLESRYRLYPTPTEDEFRGSLGIVRDVTGREERHEELQHQRDELATLDRINDLLLETVRELTQAGSREAVESAVCERLASSELYQFAWVGERELDGDRIVPRTSAGRDGGYLDAVTIIDDESETGDGPVGRAMRTGEVVVSNVDDPAFEPRREAARERGFASVAAVPLQHEETVYGVLVVYATREDAFSPRETAGFDVLGRTVGLVIHAAKSRDLLLADSVVELEFRLGDDASPFARVAADLDCELSLEGHVASGDRWILYLGVGDAEPGAVAERLVDVAHVERARTTRDAGNDCRVEVVVAESTLLDTVRRAGAAVTAATVDAAGTHVMVEAPGDANPRDMVDQVRTEYPDSTLLATQERDREIATVGYPGDVLDALTDRQYEVLEAAYRAGYYAWPRESTAEEVAAAIGLTRPTLHGHLRKAENALLSRLLDGDSEES